MKSLFFHYFFNFDKIINMKNTNYWSRFSKLTKRDWVIIVSMGLVFFFLLYMSIGMSVKMAQGMSLFGDSSYNGSEVEMQVTSTDLGILSLFWILSILLGALFVYTFFFKKMEQKTMTRKEVVGGKIVVVEEKKEEEKK